MCIILFPVYTNCESREILSKIYVRLYGWLWLVYVIAVIISMLLGHEHGLIPVSWK